MANVLEQQRMSTVFSGKVQVLLISFKCFDMLVFLTVCIIKFE